MPVIDIDAIKLVYTNRQADLCAAYNAVVEAAQRSNAASEKGAWREALRIANQAADAEYDATLDVCDALCDGIAAFEIAAGVTSEELGCVGELRTEKEDEATEPA